MCSEAFGDADLGFKGFRSLWGLGFTAQGSQGVKKGLRGL